MKLLFGMLLITASVWAQSLTCPANVTVSNDPNQCGSVVNYPAPTTQGATGTVVCSPASGSFFPVGVTTITCTPQAGTGCSFTIRVNDTQPPTVVPPANFTAAGDGFPNLNLSVNYAQPVVADNCAGVFAPICTPASGSAFNEGASTVTCSTRDAANNTATASFAITVVFTFPWWFFFS
jgi:hypothetical protein